MNEKFFVIAMCWNKEGIAQEKFVIGEFNTLLNAIIFRNAYNEHFSTKSYVISDRELLNS